MALLNLKEFNSEFRVALLPNFTYQNMRIHDFQTNVQIVSFAKSFLDLNNEKFLTYRKLERTNRPSWETTSVVVEQKSQIHVYEQGEDPRFFIYKDMPWVMIQRFIPHLKDIEITIVNLRLNKTYFLNSPLGFNGKNWVAYEYNSELYFIYSLEPFVVMKTHFVDDEAKLTMEKEVPAFHPIWEHDPDNSIGWIRGGTSALKLHGEEFFVGFSHAINNNNDIHAHTFGIYLFNPNSFIIKHKPLSQYVRNLLIDPYGLRMTDNKCEIDLSVGIADIHDPKSTIVNLTLDLDIVKLIKASFSSNEIEAVR